MAGALVLWACQVALLRSSAVQQMYRYCCIAQSARENVYGELFSMTAGPMSTGTLSTLRVVPAACFNVHTRSACEGIFSLLGRVLQSPTSSPLEELTLPLPLGLAHTNQVGLCSSRGEHSVSYATAAER